MKCAWIKAYNMTLAHLSASIFPGWKLEDPHVRDGQSSPAASFRDLDQSQVRHESAQHTYWNGQAAGPGP